MQTYDLELEHQFKPFARNSIIWGLNYRLLDDDVRNTAGVAFLPPEDTFNLLGAFVQDEIDLIEDKLKLTFGSKFEHNDFSGFEVQPSVRLAWNVDDRQTIWGAVSRAVRTPSRIDRDFFVPAAAPFLLAGGPGVESETLIAYELGYRIQPTETVSVSLSAYYNDYDNLRSFETAFPPFPPFIAGNELEGESYGIEGGVNFHATSKWRWYLGYNFTQADLRAKPGSVDGGTAAQEGMRPIIRFFYARRTTSRKTSIWT